ncbi:MAG: signal transduction histidine kinase [Myxococcota bacterium]|jgi:signal transduction histidine kinase
MSEPALKLGPDELDAASEVCRPQGQVLTLPAPDDTPKSIDVLRGLRDDVVAMFRSPLKGSCGDQLREAQKALILSRTVVLIWISVVVMPTAIWGHTGLMAPQHLPAAIGIVLTAIAAVLLLRIAVVRGVFDNHYHLPMLVLVGGIFGLTGAAILELTIEAESNFFFAFFLIYFAFTSLFPAEVIWILATSAMLIASYVGVNMAWPGPFEVDSLLISNLIYLLELTFIGVVLNRVITKLFFNERLAQIKLGLANDELGRANDDLLELDRAKTTFFSNISHELRTPMTLILTPLIHMIREESSHLDTDTVDKLKGMRGNANRMLKMVNSLLDFARLEAGRVDIITSDLVLDDVLGHIASLFRGTAEQRGTHFELDNQCIGSHIISDLDMIEQMLVNLIGNALKFTPAGGTIILGVRSEDDCFVFSVSDTGIGIAPEHQHLVFRRFSQVQQDQNVSVRGTGIGLAMVKEYANLLGGKVELESERGKGSTFSITLPAVSEGISRDPDQGKQAPDIERSAVDKELALADLVREETDEARERNKAPAGARRVLVVDDNPELVRLVSSILESRYNLFLAYNGAEALERLHSDTVDLVVSDVMMPGISGLELCEKIRADESTRHIPVILLTARGGSAEKIEGLDIGADDYIGKPFDPAELLARIRSLFDRGQLVSDLQERSVELQDALKKLKDEEVKLLASEKLRVMGDLAAGIFHELHNYLNMINNGAQPLKELVALHLGQLEDIDEEDIADINELIELMLEASNAALSVTGELKAYAHHTTAPKDVDIHKGIRSAIRMFGALKIGAKVNFEFHDQKLMQESVPSRLLVIFTNLVKNAFEAMDGAGLVTIISEPLEGGGAVIRVRDTGPGVPQAFQSKLFEPFQSTKKQGEGLGLGLPLSQKVVEELGGEMYYDNNYTDGAQFVILLPKARWV